MKLDFCVSHNYTQNPTYRHIYICGNTWDEDHVTSVCPTEQMDDKTCPVCKLRYSRKDVMLRHYRNKHGQQKSKEKRCSLTDRGIYTTTTTTTITRSILWHWTWTDDRSPPNRYNPTLKTQVIFAVIWDSIPARERCIKTKEIPSPERNTLKETPYFDSIWLRICRKWGRFNWQNRVIYVWRFISQKPLQRTSTSSCMQNLTTSLKLIETDKSCLTTVHNEYLGYWHSIEKTSPLQTGV